jgi:hypothetical protein
MLLLANLSIETTEAVVTMPLQRAHGQLLGQREGLPGVGFSPLNLRRITLSSILAVTGPA